MKSAELRKGSAFNRFNTQFVIRNAQLMVVNYNTVGTALAAVRITVGKMLPAYDIRLYTENRKYGNKKPHRAKQHNAVHLV